MLNEQGAFFNLPHNTEAEQSVLGVFLQHNEAVGQFSDLRAEHFYQPHHQWIFRKLRTAIDEGKPCNVITLGHLLDDCEGLTKRYLVDLISAANLIGNPSPLVNTIIELAMRRELVIACQKVLDAKPTDSLSDLICHMATGIDSANRHALAAKLVDGEEVKRQVYEGLKDETPAISTGFPRIDHALNGGIRRRKMYLLGGSSGDGKTLLAVAVSNAMKRAAHKHLFICAEMGATETHARSVAIDTKTPSDAFINEKKRTPEFWANLSKPTFNDSAVIYYDDPFLTFDALKQCVATAVTRHKINGFVLDYGQLVGGFNQKGNKSDFYGEVAQWIAAACKRWNIWAIVTVQMNREDEILGSGGFMRAADDVFYIRRPDKTKPEAWLKRAKARGCAFWDVGSEAEPSLIITENGYFVELERSYYYGE